MRALWYGAGYYVFSEGDDRWSGSDWCDDYDGRDCEEIAGRRFPYSTFAWHPLSVEVAIANIKYVKSNWKKMEEHSKAMSDYFRHRLER